MLNPDFVLYDDTNNIDPGSFICGLTQTMLISDSYVWILRNAVDLRQVCVCYGKY